MLRYNLGLSRVFDVQLRSLFEELYLDVRYCLNEKVEQKQQKQ